MQYAVLPTDDCLLPTYLNCLKLFKRLAASIAIVD